MRIPSGVTDQVVAFVAVDSTDFTTRETGLTSFTVYRSRNGGTATAMTTPTVSELDATNMPGVYTLLLDEDMTIGSGNDSEAMVFHITQASMAPVTIEIELYRPKITAGETLTSSSGAATVGTNNDKTGYSLTQSFPTNFADLAVTATTGRVTVGTNNDKTGYSISGTKTTLDDLNDVSTAQVNAEADTALTDYDPPTRAELTSDINSLNDITASDVVDALAVRRGTAQAGAADSVTLDASASATDDIYNECIVLINGGTGVGQARLIDNYTGSTKVAEITPNWTTNPSSDSTFVIVPGAMSVRLWRGLVPNTLSSGRVDSSVGAMAADTLTASALATDAGAEIADAVWDEAQSGHTTAGTFGEIATEIASILADTNELQTDDVPGLIAALNNISAADVNAQVLDVLNTDTFAEPTGVPAATVTLATKIGFLYMALRNRIDITATKKTFYDDGDTAEWEKDLSDNGTTYSESEGNAI